MSNVHNFNQDNVLGDLKEDSLSPGIFSGPDAQESSFEESAGKKKNTILPLVIGVGAAVVMVGFFGWKIVSPYFSRNNGGQDAGFAQMQPVGQQPAPTIVMSPASQPAVQSTPPVASAPLSAAADPAASSPVVMKPETPIKPASMVQVQPTQNIGLQQTAPVTSQPVPQSVQGVLVTPLQPAGAISQQSIPDAEIAKVNGRIDSLEKGFASLKAAVDRIDKLLASQHVQAAHPVVAAHAEPAIKKSPVVVAKKAEIKKPAEKITVAEKKKEELAQKTKEQKPASTDSDHAGLTLKAVLEGRAWIQTKSGDSITVAPGDDVSGHGVVKSIDPDRGEVRFSDGTVLR